MATNQAQDDPNTVVLQSWVNDQLIAAEKLMSSQLRDLEKLLTTQLRELKEHNKEILIEKDNALRAALAASEKAVSKAEDNAEKWRANANEWRAAMTDKDKLLLQRTEFETYQKTMNAALAAETKRADIDQGRGSGLSMGWGILVAVIGILLTMAAIGVTVVGLMTRAK